MKAFELRSAALAAGANLGGPTGKEGCVDTFLSSNFWHFGNKRERTRMAVREFLLSMTWEQLHRLVRRHEVLVIATARHLMATSVTRGIATDVSCLNVVHLSPEIEQVRDSEVRTIVFEGLTRAFSLVDGLSEMTAVGKKEE
jgi:hypothetical protein